MHLEQIRKCKPQLQALARTYHIDPYSIRVFGSVAAGISSEASDVDFLVKTLPECDLFDLAGFHEDVGAMLDHEVDVFSERSIPSDLQPRIFAQAVFV